jgi:type IV secretory pathway VirB2 component (pilin)
LSITNPPSSAVPARPSSPSAPGAPPQRRRRDILDLPRRGDVIASRWLLGGLITYVTLALVFVVTLLAGGQTSPGEIIGLGKGQPNYTVAALVLGGILLVGVTFGGMFFEIYEARTGLRDEEQDVEWVRKHGREGVGLVFADPMERDGLFAAGERSVPHESQTIETLVDDRVWHVQQARRNPTGAGVSPEELRGIAQQRTQRYGSFARYAASLLLLLAVLGTFAGVKTALPALIRAVATAGTDTSSIVAPLQAVADAFGGNALALIGAIAVGLAGHGMAVGRRHFLERLEIVSVKFIYGAESAQTTDTLQAAVHALQRTASEFQSSNGALLGIEAALEALGSEFNKAISTLDDRIIQALTQQERALHEQTARGMQAVEKHVGELSDAVRTNALQYTAIIDQVGARTEESRAALQEMKQANERLTQALDGVLALGEASRSASEEVKTNVRALIRGSKAVEERVEALTQGITVAQPAIGALDGSLRTTVAALEGMERRAVENWERVGQRVVAVLDERLAEVARPAAPLPLAARVAVQGDGGGAGVDREALTVLRRIASGLDEERERSAERWRLVTRGFAAASVAVVVLAAGLSWLAGVWHW